MDPNDVQIGGNHYKEVEGEQHWDRQWRLNGRGYFVGQITKYVERYHLKNGKQDLEKARHFLDKLITLEYPQVEKLVMMILESHFDSRRDVYRCAKCGDTVVASSTDNAQSLHGTCAGGNYVRQD